MLDDYLVNNLRISYNWENKIFKTTQLSLQINNLLNNKYVSNAWVYHFISDNWDPRGKTLILMLIVKEDIIWLDISRKLHETIMLSITLGF